MRYIDLFRKCEYLQIFINIWLIRYTLFVNIYVILIYAYFNNVLKIQFILS